MLPIMGQTRHFRTLSVVIATLAICSFAGLSSAASDAEAKPNWTKKTKSYMSMKPSYDAMLVLRLAQSRREFGGYQKTCEQIGVAIVRNVMWDHKIWWNRPAQAPLRRSWARASGDNRSCNWIASTTFQEIARDDFVGLYDVAVWAEIKNGREALQDATREIMNVWVKGSTCGDVWDVLSGASPASFPGASLAFSVIGKGLGRYCRP